MIDYDKLLEQLTNNPMELQGKEPDFIQSLNDNGIYTDKQKEWFLVFKEEGT